MPNTTPQVRKGRKFDQVVQGAREVFLATGFDRASVDDIARTAGVSKATLYSYFPDKRLLFVEVMEREAAAKASDALDVIDFGAPPSEVMPCIAETLVNIFVSEFGQQMYRMGISETPNFQELGQRFYEAGPLLIERTLVPYFEAAEARGQLNIPDKVFAANQFASLCESWLMMRVMLGVHGDISDTDRAKVVEGAAGMFLSHYAT
ncbi:MAG: TetR/AcrR family transcriptional regulator [Pseudomonadota bacterium]